MYKYLLCWLWIPRLYFLTIVCCKCFVYSSGFCSQNKWCWRFVQSTKPQSFGFERCKKFCDALGDALCLSFRVGLTIGRIFLCVPKKKHINQSTGKLNFNCFADWNFWAIAKSKGTNGSDMDYLYNCSYNGFRFTMKCKSIQTI